MGKDNKKELNLDTLKTINKTENDVLAPSEETEKAVKEHNIEDDFAKLDKEIEEEEALANKKNEEKEQLVSVKSVNELEMGTNVIKETEQINKDEEIKRAEDEAKKIIDDMLDDSNLELTDSEIYKKEEEKRNQEKERKETIERYKSLQESYRKTIIERDADDLSQYQIALAPTPATKILSAKMGEAKTSAWGLYYSGKSIVMTEFGGPELQIITNETSNNDLIDQVHTFEIIHSHVVDPNKGELSDWLQKFTYLDLDDLFFNIYKATFKGTNYGSFDCKNEKCKNVYMADMKFEDMVNYKNDEIKTRMQNIIKQDPTTKDLIKKKMINISSDLACTINIPSLYKIIFEQRVLSSEFRENNEDLMNTLLYIDEIFVKDKENKLLSPLDTRPDPTNQNLSIKRKIAVYAKTISRLDVDQYSNLKHEIGKYNEKYTSGERVTYRYPEVTCPKCGYKNEAQEDVQPLFMLFLRSRLGRVLNISES